MNAIEIISRLLLDFEFKFLSMESFVLRSDCRF